MSELLGRPCHATARSDVPTLTQADTSHPKQTARRVIREADHGDR
jgi:hypothetical protein